MSWNALPREVKEMVVREVDQQDKRIAQRRREWEIKAGAHIDGTQYVAGGYPYGMGIAALHITSSECREMALPYLFSYMNLHELSQAGLEDCLASGVAKATRSVSLGRAKERPYVWRRDEKEPPSMRAQLDALGSLPRLESVVLNFPHPEMANTWTVFGHSYLPPDRERLYREDTAGLARAEMLQAGVLPSLVSAASRITSWTSPKRRKHINPSVIREVSICPIDPELRRADKVNPWAFDFDTETEYPSTCNYLSQSSEDLRTTLADCTSLRSFHAMSLASEAEPAIHSSWLSSPTLPSSLTSLSLVLGTLDSSVFSFLALFPALEHLALRVPNFTGDFPLHPSLPLRLPSLLTLELHQEFLSSLSDTLFGLRTPRLTTLTASVSDWDDADDFGDSPNLRALVKQMRKLPSLQQLHLTALSEEGVWSHGALDWLRGKLWQRDRRVDVVTHWAPLNDTNVEDGEQALNKAEELLEWEAQRVKQLRAEGAESRDAQTLLMSVSSLMRMQEVLDIQRC
ncbi:hypothetical protein JCM10213_006154 [Rhodosporidiobolus nylandii]